MCHDANGPNQIERRVAGWRDQLSTQCHVYLIIVSKHTVTFVKNTVRRDTL